MSSMAYGCDSFYNENRYKLCIEKTQIILSRELLRSNEFFSHQFFCALLAKFVQRDKNWNEKKRYFIDDGAIFFSLVQIDEILTYFQ